MVTIPSLDVQRRRSPRSLEAIAAEVAHALDVTMEELRSKRRRPDLVQARGVVAQRALLEGVANMSQVARYLNRAPSTISDLLHGRRLEGYRNRNTGTSCTSCRYAGCR